jgi:PhzF family phenazine biosynthesis protein
MLPIYQVDAFTSRIFGGNPAAVCPLESWLDDERLQSIAAENNLSETAFFVRSGAGYDLRWMTPTCEVDLCGHATLASAYVIFRFLEPERSSVSFQTRSGELIVQRDGDLLTLDFPARPARRVADSPEVAEALGNVPAELWAAQDYMAVFGSEQEVRALKPDMARVAALDCFALIVTAPGTGDTDFVSRFFAPGKGIPEDPVTGRAHCTLIPYWAARLGKPKLNARQVSARGGELFCEHRGPRVSIAGRAALFLEGRIHL